MIEKIITLLIMFILISSDILTWTVTGKIKKDIKEAARILTSVTMKKGR